MMHDAKFSKIRPSEIITFSHALGRGNAGVETGEHPIQGIPLLLV